MKYVDDPRELAILRHHREASPTVREAMMQLTEEYAAGVSLDEASRRFLLAIGLSEADADAKLAEMDNGEGAL